jgi:MFS family permease
VLPPRPACDGYSAIPVPLLNFVRFGYFLRNPSSVSCSIQSLRSSLFPYIRGRSPPVTMAKQGKAAPKLPIRQMVILAVARFAEPLAYTSVFPYLPEMIRDFGVEQNEVAKYAGITSAVFSFAQSLTAVPWGKASDRYGRKPTLLIGLICTMVTFVVWGMSTSLTMAITVRAIQGAGNGNVGIIRTMVAEMVPEKELQPRAFSLMPLVWSLGSVVGPSFGGFLAQPAKKFPALFGGIEYFKRFPYALPNLVAMVFFLISASCAFFFLHETLPTKRGQRDPGIVAGKRLSRALGRGKKPAHRRSSFVDGEATAPLIPSQVRPIQRPRATVQPTPGLSEVFTYQTVINLASYTFLAFHSVAYDQNLTVFLNYPVMEHSPKNTKLPFYFNGGFGLNSGEIGTIFAVYGVVCGLVQFILYSPLVTRYGVLRCFRVCCECHAAIPHPRSIKLTVSQPSFCRFSTLPRLTPRSSQHTEVASRLSSSSCS